MIDIFYSGNFYLNDIYSKDKQICIATTESNILNEYGIVYSEDVTLLKNSGTSSSYYKNEDSETEDIVLQLWHVDENDKPLIWDDEKLKDTYSWLIGDEEFLPFVSEDNMNLTYYFKVTKIVKFFNFQLKGYLEVTFKPFTEYAYHEYVKPFMVTTPRVQYMFNYSNIDHSYPPIFELKNLGDEKTVNSIKNLTSNKDAFEIVGLKKNQTVIIDMLTGAVIDIETDESLFSKCNKKWFKMSEQGCNVEFKGNMQIVFKAQFPVRL